MSRRRNEEDEYRSDAFYEAWRMGVNPDRISYDAVSDAYHEGRDAAACARDIQRRDADRRYQQEMEDARYFEEMQAAQWEYEAQAEAEAAASEEQETPDAD